MPYGSLVKGSPTTGRRSWSRRRLVSSHPTPIRTQRARARTRVMATGQKMGDRSETKVLDRAAFRIDPPRFGSRKGLLSSFVVRRSLIDRRRVATRISGSRSGSYPPKGPGNGISG